ncbi:hypothetical protein PRZ48_010263 [Zasmidium cellare]|uniref:Uncharacterized protein n=1 Tax=Zasmidium cellare TaxID=395010 RepID=A0ABR0E8A8_ZASCE|nr:hypothetical protein PRZ48_010263 [Zasmidium cellare]
MDQTLQQPGRIELRNRLTIDLEKPIVAHYVQHDGRPIHTKRALVSSTGRQDSFDHGIRRSTSLRESDSTMKLLQKFHKMGDHGYQVFLVYSWPAGDDWRPLDHSDQTLSRDHGGKIQQNFVSAVSELYEKGWVIIDSDYTRVLCILLDLGHAVSKDKVPKFNADAELMTWGFPAIDDSE